MAGPLHQFEIHKIAELSIGGVDVSFTNSSLFMVLAVAVIVAFTTMSISARALVPGRWQSLAELSYEFVANMVKENVGSEGRKYFPFFFTLFMFIFLLNLLGMIPYSFTATSHLAVTFALAIAVFIGVTIVGLIRHGMHFFSFFVPSGVPSALLIMIVPIEIVSYLARPISLGLRLFANMMAGHTMLKVFAGFVGMLGIFGVAPLAVIVALTGLEFLVAFLQAYVFAVLSCLYLHDAIHLH